MDQSCITRVEIKDLSPSFSNVMIVGIIIAKRNPKSVTIKKNNSEKCVWGFTLRDSISDFINVTVWGSNEYIEGQNLKLYVGNVVEVINAKVSFRNARGQDMSYLPDTTSPFALTCDEEWSEILIHKHNCNSYFPLLRIPTKQPDDYTTLKDVYDNGKMLTNQFLNVLTVVRSLGEIRRIKTKTGLEKETREVILMDQTHNSMPLSLWESNLIIKSNTWKPRRTTLFLADVRLDWNKFKKCYTLGCTARTILTENPSIDEAKQLENWAYKASLSSPEESVFNTLDPKTINNIMSCNSVMKKVMDDETSSSFSALVYALIYSFDIDGSSPVTVTKCEFCSGRVSDDEMCINLECPSGSGTELPSTVTVYDLTVDLCDHTGCLINCKLTNSAAVAMNECSASEFEKLNEERKTELKWRYLMKPVAARIQVTPKERERSRPNISVISCDVVPFSHYSAQIPMF